MAAKVEEAPAPVPPPLHHRHHPAHNSPPPPPAHHHHHHHHHPPPPPPPHHYHLPPPPLFHYHSLSPHPHPHHHHHHLHHHHQQLPPPPPFLCTRCKCWNFPAPPYCNPNPNFAESTSCLQAQEISDLNPNPSVVQPTELQAQEIPSDRLDAEDVEDEEEGYELVMTDEWMEFFAKSEARRQEKKRQQKRAARDMRKATRARSQAQEPSTAE